MGIATGSFAEYAVADEDKLALKPANVSFEQAAASTISGITALQALTTVGRVEAGQHVLVIGASGGVGSFAVQIAKTLGATVTGVASASKLDFVRRSAPMTWSTTRTTDIADLDDRFDLIIDIGGRTPLSQAAPRAHRARHARDRRRRDRRPIHRRHRPQPASRRAVDVRQTAADVLHQQREPYLHRPARRDARRRRRRASRSSQRATLADTPDAIRAIEAGQTMGKTVITIGSDAP